MRTAIDWSLKEEPWRSLGPRLKAEVMGICAGAPSEGERLRARVAAIKRARQQRGWSQRELAERAGCLPQEVQKIEAGYGSPSWAAWRRVEGVLEGG